MQIKNSELIYFSPTNTTKTIIEKIAFGSNIKHIDITKENAEYICKSDLVFIASPVYAGRLPTVFVSRLKKISAKNVPAVLVVVYGNRAYEDTLIELRDLAIEIGFKPIAAAAFIGEHSFSTDLLPIAKNRPDLLDIQKASLFSDQIKQKLSLSKDMPKVPGAIPYKELKPSNEITPFLDPAICTKCMICSTVCPTATIDSKDPQIMNKKTCIKCCACIKSCPVNARSMKDEGLNQIAIRLNATCNDRKEPELFL